MRPSEILHEIALPSRAINLTGNIYGRLEVTRFLGVRGDKHLLWECKCACGNIHKATTNMLRRGHCQSCGCLHSERASAWSKQNRRIHGMSGTKELEMLNSAKHRAKKRNIIFDLEVQHINIPDECPILGIPIWTERGIKTDHSPSLDRIDNTKGYVPDNVWVISWRANTLKSDATLDELKLLVAGLEKKLKEFDE